jgi:nucleoside permease NupC
LQINWHAVFWGMSLQFWFAVFIRKTAFGSDAFQWLADRFVEFLKYTDKGSQAVFGEKYTDHRFVFQVRNFIYYARFFLGIFL